MLARIERRLRYEITRRWQSRATFRDAIAENESLAAIYIRGLGVDLDGSCSTGADLTDYMLLHRYVLLHKPRVVVEFGSGKSSVVLGHALKQTGGHLVTFEAIDSYHRDLLPLIRELPVTAVHAEAVEAAFDGIRGVRYDAEIPDADLFFVDGPTEILADGSKGACLDILFYLRQRPKKWVVALIDQKFSTQLACESVLPGRVRYDPVRNVGFFEACGELLCEPRQPWRIQHGDVWHKFRL
ncbi:MAG TPA: hypothetical protein VGK99_05435 [Acidobacteriota bacterium]|jgi:hypothetical protein